MFGSFRSWNWTGPRGVGNLVIRSAVVAICAATWSSQRYFRSFTDRYILTSVEGASRNSYLCERQLVGFVFSNSRTTTVVRVQLVFVSRDLSRKGAQITRITQRAVYDRVHFGSSTDCPCVPCWISSGVESACWHCNALLFGVRLEPLEESYRIR